jgi:hypothetical protein
MEILMNMPTVKMLACSGIYAELFYTFLILLNIPLSEKVWDTLSWKILCMFIDYV